MYKEYEKLVKRCKSMKDYNGEVTQEVAQEVFDCVTEAIDAIEKLSKKVDEWQEEACKWNNEYYNLLDNTPHWIPVTDHTPKYSGYYLVRDNEDDVYTAYFGNTWRNWWTGNTITHWMPRPEPPKEET